MDGVRSDSPIDAVIDDGQVQTLFQPIVHLVAGETVGFEALSRGPAGTELESPIAMLDAARAAGRLGELDWLCRTTAMQVAERSGFHPSISWFINVEPAGLELECPAHLRPVLERARTELRVVLEMVERDVEGQVTNLLRATDRARSDGWGVSLDDVGAESGSLALLPFFQPDVIKLDMRLIGRTSPEQAAEISGAVRAYAEDHDAVILAEGIETQEQEQRARVFGATYGQGYHYGAPGTLPKSIPAPRNPIPLRQHLKPLAGGSVFAVLHATIAGQRGDRESLSPIASHLASHCTDANGAGVLLGLFDSEAAYLAKQDSYDAYAQTNAFTLCLIPEGHTRRSDPRYRILPVARDSALARETAIVVISPYYAGALVTQNTDDPRDLEHRLVDYIYTHNRSAVVAAGRALLDHMKLESRPPAELPVTNDREKVVRGRRWGRRATEGE
jgi:EAL domain-containing protein (putative c-di-GMP-specific phosphodiesterase class I)